MTSSKREPPPRPRRFVDLHTHTTASDGRLEPEELIAAADKGKLAAVAITDHDTTDALPRARAAAEQYPQLAFLPGIEVSAKHPIGALHILGLGIDEKSPSLRALLEELREARRRRNPKILANLRDMGIDIDMDDVLAAAAKFDRPEEGRVVGRIHIAEALRRKGYVRELHEAFDRYIGDHGPAFVDKERFTGGEIIRAVHDGGGLAALAHPGQLGCENRAQVERIVRQLVHDGLDALEIYHSEHTTEQTRLYLDLARRLGLMVTGGSDFHGSVKPGVELGHPRVPLAAITGELAERIRRR